MSALVSYLSPGHSSIHPVPRGLYVHVPFCHTICGYCDFYSEVYDKKAATPLVDALLGELEAYASGGGLRVETIFVGGGTPTTLPAPELYRLLAALHSLADATGVLEFTCEANPATVTPEIAEALVRGGVNRVSVGAQSFDRGELAVLERIHRPEQVAETLRVLRAAGIEDVNLDLIFAVPGQRVERWLRNLDCALELAPEHLSCYGLTYESGTPLFDQLQRGAVQRVDEEVEARMFEATIERLGQAGLRHYEISNFAKPGRECRHNLLYWRGERYVGIGPSAAGFVRNVRYRNVPDTAAYVRAIRNGHSPRIEEEKLSLADEMKDAAWLALRTIAGIDRASFAARFGRDAMEVFGDGMRKHEQGGLLDVSPGTIRLTRRGLLLANVVMRDLV